eukprot:TRINITY_DN1240_c1_g1_i1.p1 TRINITY_DN1240_c1_g1~~TRINITY_DN1240_c1_g1_i1.p1  ORF type:complete len:435 (+),score=96.80 TRINITY_DN1240_c1_g1_i1:94-1305(+)
MESSEELQVIDGGSAKPDTHTTTTATANTTSTTTKGPAPTTASQAKKINIDRRGGGGGTALHSNGTPMDLECQGEGGALVEMSWTVKGGSGEVDLDGSCLMFNQNGRFVETIFWDNLTSEGIKHYGDEAIIAKDEEEESKEEDNLVEEEEKEYIEFNFARMDPTITSLVFVINIFSKNKTFEKLTNIGFNVYVGEGDRTLKARYKLQRNDLRPLHNNTLIVAKIFRQELKSDKWFASVLNDAHSLPNGMTVDVLIPQILQKSLVEPLVPTWSKMHIQVLEGRGLAAEDLNGKSDPYMKITCGTVWKKKTKVIMANLTPKWTDARYELLYEDASTDKKDQQILFEVWDYDRVGKNEYLGYFKVSIPEIVPNQVMDRWFRLQSRKRKGEQALGSIHIQILKVADQ